MIHTARGKESGTTLISSYGAVAACQAAALSIGILYTAVQSSWRWETSWQDK